MQSTVAASYIRVQCDWEQPFKTAEQLQAEARCIAVASAVFQPASLQSVLDSIPLSDLKEQRTVGSRGSTSSLSYSVNSIRTPTSAAATSSTGTQSKFWVSSHVQDDKDVYGSITLSSAGDVFVSA